MKNNEIPLSRQDINKIVQRNVGKCELAKLNDYIKDELIYLKYPIIATIIQERLFYDYKRTVARGYKHVDSDKTLLDFMSPLELIQYKEILINVLNSLKTSKKDKEPEYYYNIIDAAAKETTEKFHNIYGSMPDLWEINAEDLNSKISVFNGAVKADRYFDILKSSKILLEETYYNSYLSKNYDKYENIRKKFVQTVNNLRSFLNDDQINNFFQTFDDIFYNTSYLRDNNLNIIKYILELTKEVYFTSYENIRKKFVQTVNNLRSFLNDYQINNFFQTFDDIFYNTSYLRDNNLNVIKHMLGLTKEVYFTSMDIEILSIKLEVLENSIEIGCKKPKEFLNYLNKEVPNRRINFIKEQKLKDIYRPEVSTTFIITCLDHIANQLKRKNNPHDRQIQFKCVFDNPSSTKEIQELPNSIVVLADLVQGDIEKRENERRKNENLPLKELYQPSLFDYKNLLEREDSDQSL